MLNPGELSILSKWLEEKLKIYFTKKSQRESSWKIFDLARAQSMIKDWTPIQAVLSDFRILDMHLEIEPSVKMCNTSEAILKLPAAPDYLPCKQSNSHASIYYQTGSQSIGKELQIHIYGAEIKEPDCYNRLASQYALCLDEHQINVYTKVFPLLKEWARTRSVLIDFPVPECYYGCYLTEEIKPSMEEMEVTDDASNAINDILYKFSKLWEYEEKMARNQQLVKHSSYRILILEDICRQGFKRINTLGSPFLSLLNVEECLKSLAEIHSTSWAFSELTGKGICETWPFLNHPFFLPYIRNLINSDFTTMVEIVEEYMVNSGKEDPSNIEKVKEYLYKMKTHLDQILTRARNPRTVKCLIHQDPYCSSFLIRYSFLKKTKDKKEKPENLGGGGGDANCKLTSPKRALNDRANRTKVLKRDVMIVNWQNASYGSPMIDVAFLMLTCLPPKMRQTETGPLLEIYWKAFQTQAKRFGLSVGWSEQVLYEEYMESLLYTCVIITANIMDNYGLEDNGMEAFLQAINDLIEAGVLKDPKNEMHTKFS